MELQLPHDIKLIKLSPQKEITIFLIREQLKIQKIMSSFHEAGFDASVSIGLDTLILSFAGFEEHTDELYTWYLNLFDKYDADLNIRDNESLNEKAFEIYVELADKRKRVES